MSQASSAPPSAGADGELSAFVTKQGDFDYAKQAGTENAFWNCLREQKPAEAYAGILLQILCAQGSQKVEEELLAGKRQHSGIKLLEDCLSRHTCATERLPLLFLMSEMSWEGVDVTYSSLPEQVSLHMHTDTYAVAAEARRLLLEKWHIPLDSYQDRYALHAVADGSSIAIGPCGS